MYVIHEVNVHNTYWGEARFGDGEMQTMITTVGPSLMFLTKIIPMVGDPFMTATPFPHLSPTYLCASQYQSMLSHNMS